MKFKFKIIHTSNLIINYFLDIVFDQSMFESLCKFFKYIVMNNTTEIILFCTIRNPETFIHFLETLRKQYTSAYN